MAVANPQMRQGEVRAVNKQPKRGRSDKSHVVRLISPVIGGARPITFESVNLHCIAFIAFVHDVSSKCSPLWYHGPACC